jgi:phage head maturation protease
MLNNLKTPAELAAIKAIKMATHYRVTKSLDTVTKDVDMTKRTVASIPNTYLFFDNDQDVLLPGCCAKSIQERGPESVGDAKIKNVKDHVIGTRIGKPTKLEETTISNRKVLYGESKMLTTTVGNDMLIEYQEGVIDQHSIGFRYVDLSFVSADDDEWKKWIGMIINPEDAEKTGYMFLVKEIELFEWSPVSFGSNKLSPYLGVKKENKEAVQIKIYERLDILEKQLRSGKQSDYAMLDYELETRQLKQIISELFEQEPSMKDTLLAQRRLSEDTNGKSNSLVICSGCMNQFDYIKEPEAGMGYCKCPSCGQFVTQTGAMEVPFDLDKAIKETKFFNR